MPVSVDPIGWMENASNILYHHPASQFASALPARCICGSATLGNKSHTRCFPRCGFHILALNLNSSQTEPIVRFVFTNCQPQTPWFLHFKRPILDNFGIPAQPYEDFFVPWNREKPFSHVSLVTNKCPFWWCPATCIAANILIDTCAGAIRSCTALHEAYEVCLLDFAQQSF